MKSVFGRITLEYVKATNEKCTKHSLADFIRQTAPGEIADSLSGNSENFVVKGSCGQSRCVDVPWLAVMEKTVTVTTESVYYIVYLFAKDMKRFYLCMGQGVTAA
jgi:5-methylcytosine-specific restriction protein B